jgi:hypothetical protein
MQTNINEYSIHSCDNPSICIPRVYSNINGSFISNIFQNKLKLGKIRKIDFINNHTDKHFKKVFIHFETWYDNDTNNNIKQKLFDDKIIKIVYDFPSFWKCALNKST